MLVAEEKVEYIIFDLSGVRNVFFVKKVFRFVEKVDVS